MEGHVKEKKEEMKALRATTSEAMWIIDLDEILLLL